MKQVSIRKGICKMDYATQKLIEALDRICKTIEDTNEQLERFNDNFEKCIGEFKGNAWINVSASVRPE